MTDEEMLKPKSADLAHMIFSFFYRIECQAPNSYSVQLGSVPAKLPTLGAYHAS